MAVTARFTVPGILTSTQTGGAPPLPDTTGLIFAWSLNGLTALYQNDEFLLSASGDSSSANIPSTADAPYPLTWATVGTIGTNPTNVTWNDQSGNAHNQDGTGHAPSLDDVNYQVTFNGTDQYMATSAIDLSAVNKLTLHYWCAPTGLGVLNGYLATFSSPFGDQAGSFGFRTNGMAVEFEAVDTTVNFYQIRQNSTIDTNYHLLTVVIDYTLTGASQVTCYLDGLTTNWVVAQADTLDGASTWPFSLGADDLGGTFAAHSSKHCLLFSYAQTGAEVLAWYDYLAYIS